MDSGRGRIRCLYIFHTAAALKKVTATDPVAQRGRSYLVTRDWHYPAQHACSMQVNARCVHFALFLLQSVWSSRTNFERIEVTPRITATIVTKLRVAQPPFRGKTLNCNFCMRRACAAVVTDM
jgi:hypothetical protein